MIGRASWPGVLVTAVLAACVAGPAAAGAQTSVPSGRNTLRGLPGVEVIVEQLQPELEAAGLTTASVRAAVVQLLTAARIPVYATQAANASDAKPYIYVHLNATGVRGATGYAVAVQVQVRQTLQSLVTGYRIVDAVTWDAHTVVHATGAALPAVTAAVRQFADQFVADWAAVHP
jgi:hypothetical protein